MYKSYWAKFQVFCQRLGWSSLPADPEHVASFIVSLAEESEAKSGSHLAKAAINYFHKCGGPMEKSPTDSFIVRKLLQSATKKWSNPVRKATPVSSMEMTRFGLILSLGSFKELRTAAVFLMQFGLMARFDDVEHIGFWRFGSSGFQSQELQEFHRQIFFLGCQP